MPGIEHGYSPEKEAEAKRQEIAMLAIKAQTEILKRLPDDASRMRWVDEHAAEFRARIDGDTSFRDLAKSGDIDALLEALDHDQPLH